MFTTLGDDSARQKGTETLGEHERTNLQSVVIPKIWTHFHSLRNLEYRNELWPGRVRGKMTIKNGDERY